jgi:hypothetical protein
MPSDARLRRAVKMVASPPSPCSRLIPAALLASALALTFACKPRAEPASDKPYPEASADVASLRQRGVAWTNAEIRGFYVRRVDAIGPANDRWKKEGVPAAERAQRAFQMRHDARVLARSMMKDPADVDALRARDQAKYGTPDGPTFAWLMAHEQEKGRTGDAACEAIVESAQHTDRAVNEAFGL